MGSKEPTVRDRSPRPPLDIVIEGYERALFLDDFLEAGRMPSVSDIEIAACFADLRGFTKYIDDLQSNSQESRAHEVLSSYFQIYPKAILEAVSMLEPQGESKITADVEQIRKAIVPSMFKTLGDGMMLVWELRGTTEIRDEVSAQILIVVATIGRLFTNLIKKRAENTPAPYSEAVGSLRLGFGLARGRASRLDFGRRRPLDYAGTTVNVAARLQDLARPGGLVAEVGFCDSVFGSPKFDGHRAKLRLKGIDRPVHVCTSLEVMLEPSALFDAPL